MKILGVLLLIPLSVVICPQGFYVAETDKEMLLANSKITLNLVKPVPGGNLLKICFPDETISLTSETVSVSDRSINEILRENNILPDSEAYGLVYALNPGISKLTALGVSEIKVPSVKGGRNLNLFYRDGFRILLTLDKGLKTQLGQEIIKLAQNHQVLGSLEASRFPTIGFRTSTLRNLDNLTSVLGGIETRIVQRVGRPIPVEIISQLIAETQAINTEIEAKVRSNQAIGNEQSELVAAVMADLQFKARIFTETAAGEAPEAYPTVPVLISTLRNRVEVTGLRIFYLVKALQNKPERAASFGQLSPVSRSFPVSGYCFWAKRDGESAIITNVQCESIVEGNGTIQVQLAVIK